MHSRLLTSSMGHLTRLYDTVNNTVNNTECDIIIMQESVYSAHACI